MRPQRPSLSEKTAAIACAVAEAFWDGIPTDLHTEVDGILPPDMAKIVTDFRSTARRPL
jgi:hypothetical protein